MSHYDDLRENTKINHPKKKRGKGGRKRIEIDYATLDKLCSMQCTGEECAAILSINYDTLNAALKRDKNGGFSEYFKQKSAVGKMSLRRRQYEVARDGNPAMLIWLGKQWLNQSDKSELETTVKVQQADDEAW